MGLFCVFLYRSCKEICTSCALPPEPEVISTLEALQTSTEVLIAVVVSDDCDFVLPPLTITEVCLLSTTGVDP